MSSLIEIQLNAFPKCCTAFLPVRVEMGSGAENKTKDDSSANRTFLKSFLIYFLRNVARQNYRYVRLIIVLKY